MLAWLKKPRVWISLLGTGLFLYFLLRTLDYKEFADALREANYLYITPAVAIYFIAVWFRSWRWQVLLGHVRHIPVRRLYPSILIGYMVNNVLPARVGDLYRSYLLGDREKLSWSAVLASIVLERMFDTLILILLGFSITLVVSVPSILSTTLLVLSIILALVSVAGMAVARSDRLARLVTRLAVSPAPQRWKPKVATFIGEFIVGLQPLKKPQLFPVLVILTAIVWFIEASVYYLVALAFGLDLGTGDLWLGVLFSVAASNLLTAAPSSSGGIGPFEFGAQRTLVHFGVTQATATAFALVIHATLLLPVVAAGLFFLWVYHIPFRTISREAVAPPARLGSTVAGGNKEQ